MDTGLDNYMEWHRKRCRKIRNEMNRLLQKKINQRNQYKLMWREMLAEYKSRRTGGE